MLVTLLEMIILCQRIYLYICILCCTIYFICAFICIGFWQSGVLYLCYSYFLCFLSNITYCEYDSGSCCQVSHVHDYKVLTPNLSGLLLICPDLVLISVLQGFHHSSWPCSGLYHSSWPSPVCCQTQYVWSQFWGSAQWECSAYFPPTFYYVIHASVQVCAVYGWNAQSCLTYLASNL